MLTYEDLTALEQATADDWTLTVYLNGRQSDPAARHVWRTQIRNQLSQAEPPVEDGPEARAAFEEAVALLDDHLSGIDGQPPEPGWLAVISGGQVRYSGTIPVTVPNLAHWDRGLLAAPYVRALKQLHPIIVVLADHRRARLLRYTEAEVESLAEFRADTWEGDLNDANVSKRPTSSSGVRGGTGTDRADRHQNEAYRQMLKEVAARLTDLIGEAGFCIVGGTPEVVKELFAAVPDRLSERILAEPGLEVDTSQAEVRTRVRASAHALRDRQQMRRVRSVLDASRSNGRGAAGLEPVRRALAEHRVESLLLTKQFIREQVRAANDLVKVALQQHADVEEISGESEGILQEEAAGVAARLRFTV